MACPTLPRRATLVASTLLFLSACNEPNAPRTAATAAPALATHAESPLAHWQRVGQLRSANAIAVTNAGVILAASDFDGVFRSEDDGLTWRKVDGVTVGATSLAVASSGEVYAGTTAGVIRSLDGGTTWTPLGLEERYISVVGVDARGAVFAGSPGFTGGLYRWSGEGQRWTRVYIPLSPRDFTITYLSIRKSDLFLGTYTEGEHWLRADDSQWQQFFSLYSVEEFLPPTTAMLETDGGSLLAGFFQGILRSDDAGSSDEERHWRNVLPGIGVQRLTLDASGRVYASTDDGSVYRSSDDGVTWTLIAAPLNKAFPKWLTITPTGRMITATFEGVFRTNTN